MAKGLVDIKASFKQTRNRIEDYINERANHKANEITSKIVDLFVKRAKDRLDRFADDESVDGESASLVKALKGNISSEKSDYPKNYNVVRFKRDPYGLMMYLEYGTGLVGEQNKHPDADYAGWSYAINRNRYKRLPSMYYSNTKGYGWFFTRKPTSFVSKSDVDIHQYTRDEIVKVQQHIVVKRGKRAGTEYDRMQPYHKKSQSSRSIFTQGIKPVRFIYDTTQEIRGLFKYKKQTLSDLEKGIEKLEKL